MPSAQIRKRAKRQAAGLLTVTAAFVAVVTIVQERPADADALLAEVSPLRSQAAEVALVRERHETLPERFRRAHVEQLERKVQRQRETLAGLHVQPELGEAHRKALAAAGVLADTLSGMALAPAVPVRDPANVFRVLEQVEGSLQSR